MVSLQCEYADGVSGHVYLNRLFHKHHKQVVSLQFRHPDDCLSDLLWSLQCGPADGASDPI